MPKPCFVAIASFLSGTPDVMSRSPERVGRVVAMGRGGKGRGRQRGSGWCDWGNASVDWDRVRAADERDWADGRDDDAPIAWTAADWTGGQTWSDPAAWAGEQAWPAAGWPETPLTWEEANDILQGYDRRRIEDDWWYGTPEVAEVPNRGPPPPFPQEGGVPWPSDVNRPAAEPAITYEGADARRFSNQRMVSSAHRGDDRRVRARRWQSPTPEVMNEAPRTPPYDAEAAQFQHHKAVYAVPRS